jgi:hypothetical protein
VSTLLHATVYMFLHNLLNVLVQIANKMGLKNLYIYIYISIYATFTSSSGIRVFWRKVIQGTIPCSLLHFEAVTLLPNLYYGPKQTPQPWLRYSVDSVLGAFKQNCKVLEM